jgi:UDP-N-acetylmuramoyl-tripeptide--D-alanyl-D-alanine ligase
MIGLIRGLVSLYRWQYPAVLVYMLQSTEYRAGSYLVWFWQTTDFSRVTYRRALERTKAARLLLLALRLGMAAQVIAGFALLALWYWRGLDGGWQFGLAFLFSYPLVWAHLAVVPLVLGRLFIVAPKEHSRIRSSEGIFREHPGVTIAIAGSYGKTSMKELLVTVLGETKQVAATPANKNVAISHAHFARKLTGQEDVVIIEYGEAKPGDVTRFAKVTHPTYAIVTGIAPAHLDRYKTLERAGQDIFSVAHFVEHDKLFVNNESSSAKPFIKGKDYQLYDQHGALGWKASDVHIDLDGTRFTLSKGSRVMKLKSGLVGRHQIGPLVLAAALAAELGLTDAQIKEGVARTAPFEHRMRPYRIGAAWAIDDTYNGNIEGVRAGTALLKELTAKRKIYVTPGLVDQGDEAEAVHIEVGQLIAAAQPDIVVLMQNSVTGFIEAGLKKAGFKGEVIVETDPLDFYTHLDLFVAAGDLVLMQNDWTDNYR